MQHGPCQLAKETVSLIPKIDRLNINHLQHAPCPHMSRFLSHIRSYPHTVVSSITQPLQLKSNVSSEPLVYHLH